MNESMNLTTPGCVFGTLIHSQVDVLRGEETGVPTQQSKTCNCDVKATSISGA